MKHLHGQPTKLNINWKLIILAVFILSIIPLCAHEIETVTVALDLTTVVPDSFTTEEVLHYCEFLDGIYDYEHDECTIEVLVSGI